MNTEALQNDIFEQFAEPTLVLDTKVPFRTVGSWDSLTGMAIIVMIEDKYGVKISDSEFRSLITVQDIIDFVQKNSNQ